MKKYILSIVLMLSVLGAVASAQTQIDINTKTKGNLLANRLGAGTVTNISTTCNTTKTWNLNSQLVANGSITTTGVCVLNITNPVITGNYVLILTHGSGGSITLGTGCTWKVSNGGAGSVTQSAATGAIDILAFFYDGTNCYANFNSNFN